MVGSALSALHGCLEHLLASVVLEDPALDGDKGGKPPSNEGPAQLQCLIAVEGSTHDSHVRAIQVIIGPGAVYLDVTITYMASREVG